MTYRELFYKATRLIDNGEITLGEYEEMTKPLDREIEQEPCDDCCNGNQIEKAKLCQKSYIAGMEHKQEPKWIPVSERLPEERGVYIVTEKVFSLDDREHKGRYNTMVEQVEYYNGKWQRASFFEVIAWTPLPKPYKAESEDKE